MRTTIDLPEDLHHAVTAIASHTRTSMNRTVADLLRRGLNAAAPARVPAAGERLRMDRRTGLPLIRTARPVTAEDVRALEDE